ncbi:hypothetical protein BTUL_0090g00100 [Botrytis tulipae]|uniref:Uncharacterized protein n=1 Tax=Botrytis tulipae TaxID=87230 RepID=A0A4Z1EM93_9HELO|nr:hypothetical protein BTUL_0090g00100 [Botrytis tulipae]
MAQLNGNTPIQSVNIGYILGQYNHLVASTLPKILWLVASPLGVEKIAINAYPHSFLHSVDGLAFCAGIRDIEFIYNTGIRSTWGADYDAASVSFFLQDFEHLAKFVVYKVNSVVYHLQFITDLNRTSELMPPAPTESGVSFDCVEDSALDNGYIVGLCGCFVNSERQLNCFGIISSTTVASSKSIWVSSEDQDSCRYLSSEEPLGGGGNHVEFERRLLLDKRLQSIQVSKNTVSTRYCRREQVTGLLFQCRECSEIREAAFELFCRTTLCL